MGEASEGNQPTSNDAQDVPSTATALDDTTETPKSSSASAPGSVHAGEGPPQEPDAASGHDDSSSESGSSTQSESSIDTQRLRTVKSTSIYKAYKNKLRAKSERARPPAGVHGANLVESLIDYMRVLEDRIDALETGSQDRVEPPEAGSQDVIEPSETGLSKEAQGDQGPDSETVPAAEEKEVEVAVAFKFYRASPRTEEDPDYYSDPNFPNPDDTQGTFTCTQDAQHLIRALYRARPSIPPKDTPELAPNPDDMEILLLNVVSDPIASFFASKLGTTPDLLASRLGPGGPHLLRFGRPFKPILQNFSSLKYELKELEQEFGESDGGGDSSNSDLHTPPLHSHEKQASEKEKPAPEAWWSPVGLTHVRLFVEFIEKYLGHDVRLYQDLRTRKAGRVAFENLWMLFAVQDTIYCPSREPGKEVYTTTEDPGKEHRPVRRHTPQAYRVVATEGGMPNNRKLLHTPVSNRREKSGAGTDETGQSDMVSILPSNRLSGTKPVTVRDSYSEFRVYCFYVDFNGNEYGIVRDVFVFRPYDREVDIQTLQAYPLVHATRNNLVQRGLQFMEATVVSHMQYEGLTVGTSREDINSPVVLDMKLAFEGDSSLGKQQVEVPKFSSGNRWSINSSSTEADAPIIAGPTSCSNMYCSLQGCSTGDRYISFITETQDSVQSQYKTLLEELETNQDGPLSCRRTLEAGDIIVLLPGAVPAFALRNRKWVLLDLNLLKPVEKTNEWKNLVLPKGHRKMVQAMVETHTAVQTGGRKHDPRSAGMDLVRGKGRGCIILLHGVPGVGKTSTAECVAAHTSKPLYPITCGDIGYRPEDVERNMENHFKLAHKWGCVLLLDEADVFLAKRDQRDVQRNGLVSVFLRILEYYSGILFLTTNRVGSIDDAFRSRLHLTLYYPKLTKEQTTKIFKRNFKRIANVNNDRQRRGLVPFECQRSEQKAVIKWAEETWKKLRWNGRQIRNTFQTVLALAEFDARGDGSKPASPVVTKSHFKIVASASIQFNQYLKQTHGHDEDIVAKRDMIRADNFPMEFGDESSENDSSSSSEDSGDSDDSGTEGDSEETGSDSDDEKRKKKKSSSSKSGGKEKKGSKAKGEKSGKSGKKNRGEADGKSKGDKKTKQKKKKDEEDNSDKDESETDDSE